MRKKLDFFVSTEELFILAVADVYTIVRCDKGWWWPKGHPLWGETVAIPVFSPPSMEELCRKSLLGKLLYPDIEYSWEDEQLRIVEVHDNNRLLKITAVRTTKLGRTFLQDKEGVRDAAEQFARKLVTLWKKV
jgi:hypothetical protein